MNSVYFDNSATTKPCAKAVENVNICLEKEWANPSSLYGFGASAEMLLDSARETAARSVGAKTNEIFFTSGGSEANNTCIRGAAYSLKKRGNRIVTSSIEHPSVLNTVKQLEKEGFEVVFLKPEKDGVVSKESIFDAVNKNTVLVSLMLVNNEIGSVQNVRAAAEAIKVASSPALLHCDAVQAYGKMPVKVHDLKVDLMSVSGHKIHAPKGVGFFYKSEKANILPLIYGGGQEKGLRSGTESVPLIYGLKGAVDSLPDIPRSLEKMRDFRSEFIKMLTDTGFVTVNSDENTLPYILNISVPGYKSETLLHFLESKNIFVSSGSACAKGETSYVLSECGIPQKLRGSALRLSFNRENTLSEAKAFISALTEAVNILRRSDI